MTATAPAPASAAEESALPTIWGCTPPQVHDRFWAAFGVQVVRQGERSEIVEGAELFLLCEPGTLVLFRLPDLLDTLHWLKPRLLVLRLRDARPRAYREVAVTEGDRLVRFERVYRDARARSARAALTTDAALATAWQNASDLKTPWRWLRRQVPGEVRLTRAASARVYDEHDPAQVMECVRDVVRFWERPDTTITRTQEPQPGMWVDPTAQVDPAARCVGTVWVGAGRRIEAGAPVVGPAVLWDVASSRPVPEDVRWVELEPTSIAAGGVRRVKARQVIGKRAFDIVFALVALALVLPLFPLVALAILLEDGRPIFFAHKRETVGGREFPCLKFRSMRKDAGAIKERLAAENQADGPQFFIENDPRVTKVGRVIRKLQIDELPQFVNVLLGHMSIVGPRPSPYKENQYCPPWREARLSVRPGVTGLWQVSRTRRKGLDFQEWIRFDLQYVENASWGLDLRIIARTIGVVLSGLV